MYKYIFKQLINITLILLIFLLHHVIDMDVMPYFFKTVPEAKKKTACLLLCYCLRM